MGRAEVGPHSFDEFSKILKLRLKKGYETYGDGSFDRSELELIREIEEELLDVVGWAYILWSRTQSVKRWMRDWLFAQHKVAHDILAKAPHNKAHL